MARKKKMPPPQPEHTADDEQRIDEFMEMIEKAHQQAADHALFHFRQEPPN